jgi:DNA gyrase subunit A
MTLMQTTFNFNMLAIVNGAPKILSLKQILEYYLEHQESVVRRRTQFELKKAQSRVHIVEGLRIALDHIDEIINIIRQSQTSEVAKSQLMNNYGLSDRQAQAILDMRLVRLTGLEREKIEAEYKKLMAAIADYKDILAHKERINQIICDELMEIQKKFGDKRRTELQVGDITNIEDEDLIEEQDIIVTLTHNGYIKRLPVDEFKSQHRGGRGVKGMGVHNDDFIEQLISSSTHDLLLFFTNSGKVYSMKGYEVPEYGRSAQGIPIINLLNIDSKEKISAVINVSHKTNDDDKYLFFTTKYGTVKRTAVPEFKNIRSNGLKAINLHDGDELMDVAVIKDSQPMIIGTHHGYALSFNSDVVRSMGRSAAGVRGIRLRDDDYVIGAAPLNKDSNVLVISENGFGKQTPAKDYPIKGRGGLGVKTVNVTKKNGPLVGMTTVNGDEDIMLVTDQGVIIRFGIESVSQTGRAAVGVHLMKMDNGAKVATMAKVEKETDDDSDQTSDDQEEANNQVSEENPE